MSNVTSRDAVTRSRLLRFDRLERRLVLNSDGDWQTLDGADPPADPYADGGSPTISSILTVDLVSPIPGSSLTSAPESLLLAFDRPIVPDSVFQDVVVYRTDAGGDVEWYWRPESLVLDDSFTQLTVEVAETLAPGSYQVWVFGDSGIMDPDGNYLTPDYEPLELGGFEVVQPGVRLSGATDLGTVAGDPIVVPGTLDFLTDQFAISLYRIELDPGHFWRLGAEITAERDGSPLDSALSLFDSEGHLIASNDIGRFGTPMDPYLFAGLDPGTYYVGVSGADNLAGTAGGYDPVSGSTGTIKQSQAGGDFRLHLVADAVDSPPLVVSLTLDRADSNDPSPTGFTLGFSRILAVPGNVVDPVRPAIASIVAVGQDGREWPVVVTRFSEPESLISYVFSESLPVGRYEVKLVDDGTLIDLAGLTPVAPGQPTGVLGTFEVTAVPSSSGPEDLGAILPKEADEGVTIDPVLPSGQSAVIRFVVTASAVYSLIRHPGNDLASVVLLRPDGSYNLPPQVQSDVDLERGEYFLRFTNAGGDTIHDALTLTLSKFRQGEIILSNGVGQTPALSLRLIEFSEPRSAPLPSEPTPIVTGPLIPALLGLPDRGGSDPTPLKPEPTDGSPSALGRGDQPTAVSTGGVSFIGWSTDLSGRPAREVTRVQGQMWPSADRSGSPSSSSRGRGQSVAATSSHRDDLVDGQGAPIGILDAVPARRPVRAAMVEIDLKQAVAAAVRLQQWAVRQGTNVSLWFGSWPGWRSRSRLASLPLALSAPGTEALRAGLDPDEERDASQEAQPGTREATSVYLRPPVVVLSVAVLAQVGWQLKRWWRSRRRSRMAISRTPSVRASTELTRSSIGVWTSASPMALSLLRRSNGR